MQIGTAIILGSGTSNGCPSLGFDYPDTFLDNLKNWRTRPSLLVQGPTGNFLVDAGPELRLQLLRERITEVDSVLITHTHADHIMGMDDLRCFEQRMNKQMAIYAQPHDQEVLRRVFSYAFGQFPPGVHVPRFDLRDVPPVLDVVGLTVETMIVMHGPTPVVGIRIGDFAYLTDVNFIPEDARAKLQNLDVLVIDAVRRTPHPNHFHFEAAIEAVGRLSPRMAYFTHLSHDYDHDVTEATELPPHIRLCYDGLKLPINTAQSR